MPPKLGARALKKKAENAKAAAKAKAQVEAEQAKARAEEKAARERERSNAPISAVCGDAAVLPPAYGRVFCVPRDAPRVLEIEVVEDEKDPKVKYIGGDFGKRPGKFVTFTPAVSNTNFYCIPYAAGRVLEIKPAESAVRQIGDRLSTGSGKYTDAIASLDYRQKLYAAPCRARKVLEVDPLTGEAKEVGEPLGDPNDVEAVLVTGLTLKSMGANGVYAKCDDKYEDFPYFQRASGVPEGSMDDGPEDPRKKGKGKKVVEAESSSDDDFERPKKRFFIYCIRKRRWCLSPNLGAKQEEAWCWQKGRESAPPDGLWNVNEEPPPAPPGAAEAGTEDGPEEEEEEEEDDDLIAPKEIKTMCTGFPRIEVRHPPKWWAIAYSPNKNRLYAVPYHARRVLMIDPTRGGKAMEVGPDLGPGRAKYSTLQLAPNGSLFAAPLNARQVLQIDDEGVVSLVGPNFGDLEKKYACLVVARNKLLYAPPLYAERVLEINCAKGNTQQIGAILGFGEAKYACAAPGANGNLYCPPLEARRVLEIRCEDHEAEELGMDLGSAEKEKFSSIAPAPLGNKLYAAPREAHKVLEIDPDRGFVREVGPELGRAPRKFTCMITGPRVQPEPPKPPEEESDAEPEEAAPATPAPAEAPPAPAPPSEPARAAEPLPEAKVAAAEAEPRPAQHNPWKRKPQLY